MTSSSHTMSKSLAQSHDVCALPTGELGSESVRSAHRGLLIIAGEEQAVDAAEDGKTGKSNVLNCNNIGRASGELAGTRRCKPAERLASEAPMQFAQRVELCRSARGDSSSEASEARSAQLVLCISGSCSDSESVMSAQPRFVLLRRLRHCTIVDGILKANVGDFPLGEPDSESVRSAQRGPLPSFGTGNLPTDVLEGDEHVLDDAEDRRGEEPADDGGLRYIAGLAQMNGKSDSSSLSVSESTLVVSSAASERVMAHMGNPREAKGAMASRNANPEAK